ncbi:MAG: c-type cytochrome domain-containing protein [Gemmataceae bacterium]
MSLSRRATLALASLFLVAGAAAAQPKKTISFNRDIRPILSNNCFVCHGPDNNLRKAKLRLDLGDDVAGVHGGLSVITAGKPAESELFDRITHADPKKRMPPESSKKSLTKEQIDLLRDWIAQGGKYEKHWSLIPPVKHEIPAVKAKAWVRNPIDAFLLARIEAEGLKRRPPRRIAARSRRLSFDLIGPPPTPEEVDAFERWCSTPTRSKSIDCSPHPTSASRPPSWCSTRSASATPAATTATTTAISGPTATGSSPPPSTRTAVRPVHHHASARRPDARGHQRAQDRLRLQPTSQTTEEGGPGQGVSASTTPTASATSPSSSSASPGCWAMPHLLLDPVTTREFTSSLADIAEASVGRQRRPRSSRPPRKASWQTSTPGAAALQKVLDTPTPELTKAQDDGKRRSAKSASRGLPGARRRRPQRRSRQTQPVCRRPPSPRISTWSRSLLAAPRAQLTSFQGEKTALQAPSTLITMASAAAHHPPPARQLARTSPAP